MASYSSSDSSKQHSPSKTYFLVELKMANRTINLKDEAIRKLEERLQRLEMKKPRSSNSINEKRHSPRLSSRGSSNDHGREEEHRRRRHHHHFHGYRPHAHGERHNREDAYHQEAKPKISFIKVPSFSGDSDRNVYLDWEAKCEQIFDVHEVHEDHKVMITSLEFIDYAMKWWHSVVKDIIYNKGRPVDSWNTLKQRMRLRFVPPHFRKDLMLKLQRFQQGALCVDSYYKVLKTLLLKVDMHESEEAMIARFVNGLRKDIQDIFELQEYSSLGSLVHLAVMVEAQLAKKNAFKNAPNDGYYNNSWKKKILFQNFLLKILLSNLRNLSLLLLFLNLQLNRLVRNALSVWVIVTLRVIVLLRGICLCIMAL